MPTHCASEIALAGGEAERQDALDLGELRGVEVEVRRGGAFLQMLGRSRAGNGDDVRGLGEGPGDRKRRRRDAPGSRERKEGLEPVPVASPVQPLEARVGVAELVGLESLDVLQTPAEKAARDRREGDQQRAASAQARMSPSSGVRVQSEYSDCTAAIG